MKIKIGVYRHNQSDDIVSDYAQLVNAHALVIGTTGAGKTTTLLQFIDQAKREKNIKIHVFDVFGDLVTDPEYTSSVRFSESGEFGINPFIISADPDYGGVRRKINSFISINNRYSVKLGIRQEACIRKLLYDLYAQRGFHAQKHTTWHSNGKDIPTLNDLTDYTYEKLKALFVGGGTSAMARLEELTKAYAKLQKEYKKGGSEADDVKIEKLQQQCIQLYELFILHNGTSREIDELIAYDSPDMLKSIHDRLNVLLSFGIFKDKPPFFETNKPIWRYDLSSLSDQEQGWIVELYLEKIFLRAKERGLARNPKELNVLAVIDEAHKFIDQDPSHIINVMIRECRKFSMALWFASQSYTHFSEDIITSCATKVVLGLDEYYHESMGRKLGIDPKRFRYILPSKTALVQIKTKKTKFENRFVDVVLQQTPDKTPKVQPEAQKILA